MHELQLSVGTYPSHIRKRPTLCCAQLPVLHRIASFTAVFGTVQELVDRLSRNLTAAEEAAAAENKAVRQRAHQRATADAAEQDSIAER